MMKCIPLEAVPGVVDGLLAKAGAPKALRLKVTEAASELQNIMGQVTAVITESTKRRITVTEEMRNEMFDLPPNQKEFEAELIRAQDGGRIASVTFHKVEGANVIDVVYVYAGHAAGNLPRY